jgi:tetratricopeptide (TPR) repeat protein
MRMDMFNYFGRSRLLLVAGIGLGIGALIAIDYAFIGVAGLSFGSTRLATTINDQTARLVTKLRGAELTSEKSRKVRDAIKHGDYRTAHQLTTEVLAGSVLQNWRYYPFADFIGGIADVNDPAFATQLNSWVAQAADDPIPLMIRAQYYYAVGWFKRGHRFTAETQTADLVSFADHMKKARADIEAATRLNDANPYVYHLQLLILRSVGASDQMRDAFREAVAKFPADYQLYDVMLGALAPKWGGNVQAMYAFVDQYAGRTDRNSPLRLLYLSLYRNLLNSASIDCASRGNNNDAMSECVASTMQKIVRPGLEDQVVAALQVYDHSDNYQFGIAIEPILSDMLRTTGGDAYSGAILELAAGAMHSNTQLKEDNPSHNNYIIDKVVSLSWFRKGFYDNSLKKGQAALKDAKAMQFPNEEERDLALAGIYEYLAGSNDQLRQYRDMIAYEQAAVRLGGKTAYEHLVCYGYYQLRDYEDAVSTCTQALKDEPANMRARYWRAIAYRDSARPEAALADLTAVADSESDLRATAAIDISMIYFNRNDNQSALNVLNKYPYLYDPGVTNRSDVAVSYNNRCYAYMQLGELKQALDDCRASLKYGSLPDAYRKTQELIERISAGERKL